MPLFFTQKPKRSLFKYIEEEEEHWPDDWPIGPSRLRGEPAE
jgi:hypothetical protein